MITTDVINEAAVKAGLLKPAGKKTGFAPASRIPQVEVFARAMEVATRKEYDIGPITDWIRPGETHAEARKRRDLEEIRKYNTREARIIENEERMEIMRNVVLAMLRQIMLTDPTLLEMFDKDVRAELEQRLATLPNVYWLEILPPAIRAFREEPLSLLPVVEKKK